MTYTAVGKPQGSRLSFVASVRLGFWLALN